MPGAQEPTERTPLLATKCAAIATLAEVPISPSPPVPRRSNRFERVDDAVEALLRSRVGGYKTLVKDSAELDLEAGAVVEDDGTVDEERSDGEDGDGRSRPSFWQMWTWDTSNMKSLFKERCCAEADNNAVKGNKSKEALVRYCRHCWTMTQMYYSKVRSLSEEDVHEYFWHLWEVAVMYYGMMRSISRRDAMWLLAIAAMALLFVALLVKTQYMYYKMHGCYWNC